MGDDFERLRDDIGELYNTFRDLLSRVIKLEERSDNRDEKLEELKTSIKALEEQVGRKLDALSCQIATLINAPAQKVAGRWNDSVKIIFSVVLTAVIMYLLDKAGLR